MKQLNLITVFAISPKDKNKQSLIASIYYSYDFKVIPFYSLSELNHPLDKTNFIGRNTNIIRVLSSIDQTPLLSATLPFGACENNKNLNKEEVKKTEDVFKKVIQHPVVSYFEVMDYDFFTTWFLQKYLFSREYKLIENVYIFENLNWKSLVHLFSSLNITLSGGSTSKRQILSPVQMNLSRFLIGVEGLKESLTLTRDSFKLGSVLHKNNLIKNFSQDKKIWLIREKIRFTPLAVHYDYICKLLFFFSNNVPAFIDFIFARLNTEDFANELIQFLEREISTRGFYPNYFNEDNFSGPLKKYDLKYYPLAKRTKTLKLLEKEIEDNKNLLNKDNMFDKKKYTEKLTKEELIREKRNNTKTS